MASMVGRCLSRKCLLLKWSPFLNVQCISHSAVLRCEERMYYTKKRAAEFMARVDKNPIYKERKETVEEYIETWRGENIMLPETISDEDWMVLITEKYRFHVAFKYLQFLLKKQFIKEKEKEKKEKKRLEKEENKTESAYPPEVSLHIPERERMEYRWNKLKAWQSDVPIILDMDFPDASHREQKAALSQINMAIRQNSSYPQPLQIHMTSVNRNNYLADMCKGNVSSPVYFHEEHFIDIFPREQLFYLSPDGPQIMKLDPNMTYIVGGLVDRGGATRLTYGIAKKLGIKCGSLPLYHFTKLEPSARKNLNINTVIEIMQCMHLHHSWKSAFEFGLISKKYTVFDRPTRRFEKKMTKETERNYVMYNRNFLNLVNE